MNLLQKHGRKWQDFRRSLAESPALKALDGILACDARQMIAVYDEKLTPGLNAMFLQLACVVDRIMRQPVLGQRVG